MTRQQLLEGGLAESGVDRRVRGGLLIAVHPGVYRVGHRAPSVESTYLAAVLACGPGALLSGFSAAHLLGLVRTAPTLPEVVALTERRIEGIRVRRCRSLCDLDGFAFSGIPVTTVARTLTDLAGSLGDDALSRVCHESGVRYRTTPEDVLAVLDRRRTVPGARRLRRVLLGEIPVTLSALERRFLRLLAENGLPLPETNRRAGTKLVDCRWPAFGLTVELDSYRYHHSRHAWEQDRRRDREAQDRGDVLWRVTYGDVYETPAATLRRFRQFFAKRPA